MKGAFKKGIEDIHHQYQAELKLALPVDLAELEVRTNENDTYWKMLKYDGKVVQLEIDKWKSNIKNKHIENMDIERGRVGPKKIYFTATCIFYTKNLIPITSESKNVQDWY